MVKDGRNGIGIDLDKDDRFERFDRGLDHLRCHRRDLSCDSAVLIVEERCFKARKSQRSGCNRFREPND